MVYLIVFIRCAKWAIDAHHWRRAGDVQYLSGDVIPPSSELGYLAISLGSYHPPPPHFSQAVLPNRPVPRQRKHSRSMRTIFQVSQTADKWYRVRMSPALKCSRVMTIADAADCFTSSKTCSTLSHS